MATDKSSASLYSGIGSLWDPGDLTQGGDVDPSGPSFYPNGTVDLKGEEGDKGDPGPQGDPGPGMDPTVLTRLDELELSSEDLSARIVSEQQLRIDADSAEATARETLEVALRNDLGADIDAKVTEERNARVDAEGALASRISTVEAGYTDPEAVAGIVGPIVNAKVAEEATARASADGALGSRLSTVEASYVTSTQANTIATTVANAKVTDEATARSSADGALSGRITAIESSYVTTTGAGTIATTIANAKVSDEATARTNADGALSNRIATIESSYQNAAQVGVIADAKVAGEATARSNADGALSGRISTVEASYQNASQVDARATTIATAKVGDEATARANADGALALRASSLESRAGSLESSVSTQASAIADVRNKTSSAYLKASVSAGNAAASVALTASSSGSSSIGLEAEELVVTNSVGSAKKIALTLRDGNAAFAGNIYAGGKIIMGNGNTGWEVAVKPRQFMVSDGQAVSWDNLGYIPNYTYDFSGLAPLAAGEAYVLTLSSPSATGAVASLKIAFPGSPQNQQVNGPGVFVGGSGPKIVLSLQGRPNSGSGVYEIDGVVDCYGNTYDTGDFGDFRYAADLSFTGTLYALVGGTWTSVAVIDGWQQAFSASPGVLHGQLDFMKTVTIPSGVTDIGLDYVGSSAGGSNASGAFTQILWQSPGSSGGLRTASPAGQQCKLTVIP